MEHSYQYTARGADGELHRGAVAAQSFLAAFEQLQSGGLTPINLDVAVSRPQRREPLKLQRRALIYEQLSDLVASGVPLLRSLAIIRDQSADPRVSQALQSIHDQVAGGTGLAEALKSRGLVPEAEVAMVASAELGGFLEEALQRLARMAHRQDALRRKVVGAMAYPAFLLAASLLVIILMLTVFVPRFAPVFEKMRQDGDLPWTTEFVLRLGEVPWVAWAIAAAAVGLAIIWFVGFRRSKAGRARTDEWLLSARGIGPIVKHLALARFCRVFGTMLQNGVPVLRSLSIARGVTGNVVLESLLGDAGESLSRGESFLAPLRKSGRVSPDLIEMLAVAEESNQLDTKLIDAADRLEMRTHARIDILVRFLEPALLLCLAGVIVLIVLALQLPLLQLGGAVR